MLQAFIPVFGQDIHYSQFINSPHNLNPALTGDFNGDYRFIGNGRRQWNSVTVPYETFSLASDARNFFESKHTGAGIMMNHDKTGDSKLTTFQLNISLSKGFALDRKKEKHLIRLGIQTGFTQKRIDYSALTYDNQYNGTAFDPSAPSNESFGNSGRIYPNFHAGITYTKVISRTRLVRTGFSIYNINRPEQSFFNEVTVMLDRRFNFHINGEFDMNPQLDILPGLLIMQQGRYHQTTLGTNFRYKIDQRKRHYRALYAGIWTRARDAGFVTFGMDYNNVHASISYDINYSRLTRASHGRGGVEISVIYIISKTPKRRTFKQCPVFL